MYNEMLITSLYLKALKDTIVYFVDIADGEGKRLITLTSRQCKRYKTHEKHASVVV